MKPLLGGIVLACLTASAAIAADLSGRISSAAGGPVEGATVFVFTAAPKVGTSPYCPSCYPDCGKMAKSDAEGNFMVPGLSSELVFKLLVVGKDFAPQFVENVTPGETRVAVTLQPRALENSIPDQTVRGRIIDPSGSPIFGAVIKVHGANFGEMSQYGGLRETTDLLAVTDEAGEFVVSTALRAAALYVRISARLHADQALLLATGKPHVVTMTEGVTVTGRVMKDGRPLANVGVGLSAQDRRAGNYAGHFEVGTDADGQFTFLNLPPNIDYHLYGLMETVGPHGTIPLRSFRANRDREKADIGDVTLAPANKLAGRVVLDHGERVPPQTRLLINREPAWDSVSVELGPNGEFEIQGIPTETISLSLSVPGYIVSPKNGSYDHATPGRRLIGQMKGDLTGLKVLMEKGRPPSEVSASSLPRWKPGEHPRDKPLRGVEPQ